MDNKIYLSHENYTLFLNPDTQHKFHRRGKGVGRPGWLKVFRNIRFGSGCQGLDLGLSIVVRFGLGGRHIADRLEQSAFVENIWRPEGPKVPARRPRRASLRLNNSACLRFQAGRPYHLSPNDFVEHRTRGGREYQKLNAFADLMCERLENHVY